jgi:CCR4-NOT transcription complex subunit 1
VAEGEVGDLPSDERVEIGRMATERLDRAGSIAPELVLIALEKLPVSI